jgi:hypothetical protein
MRNFFYHPEVHRRFGERLFYLLLSIRPFYSDKVRKQLDDFTKDKKITSYCYYEVFGDSDVLIRAWFHPEIEHAEISERITQSIEGVFHILPFEVNAIPEYWALDDDSKLRGSKAFQLITSDNITKIQGKSEDFSKILNEWKSNHLLFELNQTENIKVFIFIRYLTILRKTREEHLNSSIINTIEDLRETKQGENFSIYKGTGFAQILIKAEVRKTKFFNINNLVMKLSELVAEYDAFTTTYICTSSDYIEKDLISGKSLTFFRGKDLAVAAIIPELYSDENIQDYNISRELTQEITHWVHDNILNKNLNTNDLNIVHSALVAIICKCDDDFFDSLLKPLRTFERHLYQNRDHFIHTRVGRKNIPELYRELGIEKSQDMRKLSLGESLNIYRTAIKINTKDETEKSFLESWDPIVEVRNDVAHGSINPFSEGNWKKMLSRYLKYSSKFEALKEVIEKEINA